MVPHGGTYGEHRFGRKVRAPAKGSGSRGAGFGMVARPALANVVQQTGQQQLVETTELGGDLAAPGFAGPALGECDRFLHRAPQVDVHGMQVERRMLRRGAYVTPFW